MNVSLPGGGKRRICEGSLTDWNMRSCTSTSKLLLRAQRCRFMDTRGTCSLLLPVNASCSNVNYVKIIAILSLDNSFV